MSFWNIFGRVAVSDEGETITHVGDNISVSSNGTTYTRMAVVMVRVAAAASKAAKKVTGSLPSTRAVSISVSGVMLAVAAVPLPVATLCSLLLSAGLLTSRTQGSNPPLMTNW